MSDRDEIDPVTLSVLEGGLRAICDEMGAVLIRAAHSPNIKERHDCSTALFEPAGELVMQAEHIPVHLGSMPDAVAAVIELAENPGPDDLWILNDPFAGGTHLPDITLVSPLLHDSGHGAELIGWAATRAHHADIGGPTPGGMPADSRRLEDEGVVISPRRVGDAEIRELVSRMRNPSQRLADLRAQRAANRLAGERLAELIERDGADLVRRGMAAVLDHAERRSRAAIGALPDGTYEAEDALEAPDGSRVPLRVKVTIDGEEMRVDFAGSAPQVEGNLNCPLPVTKAAALFAVRVLTDPDAPPCAGGHRPIAIAAARGSVLDAEPGAAVAAGNVETSSRVADLVLAALADVADGPAQGQGTMNNVTLAGAGDDGFTYYETLGGGQGACADAPGPSGVHVAMSNTLNTPIEALENELPLRIRSLGLRRGKRRRGTASRRRRDRPRDRSARARDVHPDHRTPQRGTTWAQRRRGRNAGPQPPQRRGAPRQDGGPDGTRRRAADRDSRWRRLRAAGLLNPMSWPFTPRTE